MSGYRVEITVVVPDGAREHLKGVRHKLEPKDSPDHYERELANSKAAAEQLARRLASEECLGMVLGDTSRVTIEKSTVTEVL